MYVVYTTMFTWLIQTQTSCTYYKIYRSQESIRTVPDAPVIVPIHRNKLSPSGNAEIPLSPDIYHITISQHHVVNILPNSVYEEQ